MDRSGGLLLGWGENITIHNIQENAFCVEVEFEGAETNGKMRAIFVYVSTRDRTRSEQWQELIRRSQQWGDNWILGGDFNDIRDPGEKKGGRSRSEASCQGFREFIDKINIEKVVYQGRKWTWANNWQDEGFIEARLDRFFGASKWLLENQGAVMKYIANQSSNHSMFNLEIKPTLNKMRKIFCSIKDGLGNLRLRVTYVNSGLQNQKCRMGLMKWDKIQGNNSTCKIQKLKGKIEEMSNLDGQRDWGKWNDLKAQLDIAYKEEEMYLSQKARVQWLQEGDKNTKFSMLMLCKERRLTGLINWKK